MREKNTSPNVGQDNIDPSITSNVYLLHELKALGRHFGHFLSRLRVTCKRLHARIVGDRETAPERDPPRVPSIALTNDGRVLLSIHYVEGADTSGRETWTGIVLTEAERGGVIKGMADGADDAAAHVGGRLIAKAKKGEPEGSGGGQG